MKAVTVLMLTVSLLFTGCATMSKVGQDVGVVAQKVCNFDLATSAEAQAGMAFVATASGIVGPLSGIPITAGQALVILNTVANASQTGACVLLTELQDALTYFNALKSEYQAKVKGQKAAMEIPSMLNLTARIQAEKSTGK